ncbi:guanylate cyclase 32E-like [Schistocerca americana]|uniref:guanylate cyclase 32E-like n=1 Tax=Schistocerca americana TaxID=7009 RepID=UPI001F4FBA17|nr:guanylate cyclase 32E-like [Schistocerca americana]
MTTIGSSACQLKCADTLVSDKRVYFTFARTLPPSSKISKSVVALLRAFSWGKFVVVAGRRVAWAEQVRDAIKELAAVHGLQLTDTCLFSERDYVSMKPSIQEMDRIVADTFQRTRVYVFVGKHMALMDFVKCLQRRHLLDSGDYIVISVDDEIYDPSKKLNVLHRVYLDPYLEGDADNAFDVTDVPALRSVLKLSPYYPKSSRYEEVCEQIRNFSTKPPFCVPYHHSVFRSISVPIEAAHLYDAVMIYARALTEVFADGENPTNGTAVIERIRDRSYHSVKGHDVYIDVNGDAEGNYTVMALMEDELMNGTLSVSMQPVGFFQYAHDNGNSITDLPEFRYLDESRPIRWVGGRQPRAEPACGFRGERCAPRAHWRLLLALAALAALVAIAGVFAFRHYRYEHKLACLLWKIDMKDVTIIPTESAESSGGNRSMIRVCHNSVFHDPESLMGEQTEASPKRAYTKIGLYKGNIVAIKPVYKRSIDITRSIRKELKQIREVRHDNIIPFIGASVDHGNLCVLTAYCARGSLEDVLANEDLHLDNMFVSSLVSDIVKGLTYLHDSEILSHGNLKSSNCLVDSRWVLQISDFGLHEFKAGQDEPDFEAKELRRSLWRAPELLRCEHFPPRGTQKGDIYSFGIVLYEIVGRSGPWGHTTLTNAEIIERVRNPSSGRYFRPPTDGLMAAEYVVRCMQSCWDEEPDQRPDIRFVRVKLKEMQAGLKPNIFDNMLAIMEKYAYNLEELVQERTNQLTEEKKKTDALLHRMLPKTVAEALKRGDPVEAESFDCVTIYFSDIVGFTELSAVSTPLQVVDLLNDLYTCFDSIISNYDVYKVETIGDAYMVVSGLPVRNGDRHAGEIASMALHLLTRIKSFKIPHRAGETLKLRIGIHSGHCVAGVVGLKMPRYCLFGDTVNTASRMESTGEAFRIHISEATKCLLDILGGYHSEERGMTHIKGKGEMRTYWLLGKEPAWQMSHILDETHGSSYSSISSDRLETPDLLRRPSGGQPLPGGCTLPGVSWPDPGFKPWPVHVIGPWITSQPPDRCMLRARAALAHAQGFLTGTGSCSNVVHTPVHVFKSGRHNCGRSHQSEPNVIFRDCSPHV